MNTRMVLFLAFAIETGGHPYNSATQQFICYLCLLMQIGSSLNKYTNMMNAQNRYRNPSMAQTTRASVSVNPLSHTVPHSPL